MWTCPWTGWTGVGLPGLGGTANLAPADDILISVERPLAIDSMAPMVASILS